MNIEELENKIIALEKRVSELKNFEQLYENGKKGWDKERSRLEKATEDARNLKDALQRFFGNLATTTIAAGGPSEINLEHEEVAVKITHRDKIINLSTSTVNGKIFYCATAELAAEGFTESEVSAKMAEHGWNVGHTTLAPSLGRLAKDGDLVRVAGSDPTKYRIPGKIKTFVSIE